MYLISKRTLILVGLLALVPASQESPAPDELVNKFSSIDEEFVHFAQKADQTKRAHLIWSLERNGSRLKVDEFVDLDSWRQLIQFKWVSSQCQDGRIYDEQMNVLLTNFEGKPKIVHYEPYKCEVRELENEQQNATSWSKLVGESQSPQDCMSEHQKYLKIVDSIVSPLSGSPYVTKFRVDPGHEVWVLGLAGLWMKARHAKRLPEHQIHMKNGGKVVESSAWRLDLPETGAILLYYFNGNFLKDARIVDRAVSNARSNVDYESLDQVEVRDAKSTQMVDLVNVLRTEFQVRDDLLKSLFNLPIGFQCPPDASISTTKGLYLENLLDTTSLKLELEMVATKFQGLSPATLYSSTDTRSVTVAKSGHPLNSTLPLTMFHLHDDQVRTVRDFNARLRYNIRSICGDNRCEISKLHVMEDEERKTLEAIDMIELTFKNGITLTLSESRLNYMISPKDRSKMQPLNKISISDGRDEFVFEEEVPEAYENILRITDSSRLYTLHKLSLVRVYERSRPSSAKLGGVLRLKRIIILIFDYGRQLQLGQIRINLVDDERPLTMSQRARLFDVSDCYDLARESIQMSAMYPSDPILLDLVEKDGRRLVEEFYKSSLDWRLAANMEPSSALIEKFLLGSSLNYLRVPKVELKISPTGDELELSLTLLERARPINSFEQLDERTFHLEQSERMLADSPEACSAFCLQFNCMAFAYNSHTHECKLSSEKLDIHSPDDTSSNIIARQPFSKVYYAAFDHRSPLREASLAELHSYLEHSVAESGEDEEQQDGATNTTRSKREVSVSRWPLMTFSFVDKSDFAKQYGPPQYKFLVPSRISFPRVPLTWDVSGENEIKKSAQAFRGYQSNTRFVLNLLDNNTDSLEPIERTFINNLESAYYTFKVLSGLDLENCGLMCYNTQDWNAKTLKGQTCVAFSYCEFQGRCILAIKTDFNYTKSILELAQEGDTLQEIKSMNDLLKTSYGCYVSKRSHMSGFEGPIKLTSGFEREKLKEDEFDYRLDHEWVTSIRANSSLPDDADKQDECAQSCLTRNKLGKMCLAMEYCTRSQPMQASTDGSGSPERSYESTCNLLLIKSPEWPNSAKMVEKVENIRSQLVKPVKPNAPSANPNNCNRYLTSHLSLFSQNRRQTRLEGRYAEYLETPAPSKTGINLDRCALECALIEFECKAFEYCSSLDKATGQLSRNCTLYGRARENLPALDLAEVKSNGTSFSRDCHVYLRRELSSLEDLFSPVDIDRNSVYASDLKGLSVLMTIFIIVYGCAALLICLYARMQRFCCRPA